MFFHNFKYSLKTLVKNKGLVFWTLLFPILMSVFFYMAFNDIEKNEELQIMDIAIINNDAYQKHDIYKNAFNNLSKGKNKLFNIDYLNLKEAKEKLNNEEIIGYLSITGDNIKINVINSGSYETILRFVVDEITSNKKMIEDLSKQEIEKEILKGNQIIDYQKIYQKVENYLNQNKTKIKDNTNNTMNYVNIEYYTLIAMSCLYGAMLSMYVTNTKLANMNGVGKRTSISPLSKTKTILGSLTASYVVQIFCLFALLIFTKFVLKIDYGNHFALIVLLGLVGSLAGLSLGVFVSTNFKTNENNKIGILTSIVMFWCFLSGMMGILMKYIIDSNIPIVNKINPCAMITDALYALYSYESLERYWFNIISLLIFSIITLLISIRGLWRQKYDSI